MAVGQPSPLLRASTRAAAQPGKLDNGAAEGESGDPAEHQGLTQFPAEGQGSSRLRFLLWRRLLPPLAHRSLIWARAACSCSPWRRSCGGPALTPTLAKTATRGACATAGLLWCARIYRRALHVGRHRMTKCKQELKRSLGVTLFCFSLGPVHGIAHTSEGKLRGLSSAVFQDIAFCKASPTGAIRSSSVSAHSDHEGPEAVGHCLRLLENGLAPYWSPRSRREACFCWACREMSDVARYRKAMREVSCRGAAPKAEVGDADEEHVGGRGQAQVCSQAQRRGEEDSCGHRNSGRNGKSGQLSFGERPPTLHASPARARLRLARGVQRFARIELTPRVSRLGRDLFWDIASQQHPPQALERRSFHLPPALSLK